LRITNGILQREALRSLQQGQQGIADARERASTGVRVATPSDDPVATSGIMEASGSLRALEQYRRNLSTARTRMAMEDGVLEQMSNALIRARELGVSQATATADANTRQTTKAEIDGLIDFVRELGNTKLAGAYLFGGAYADSEPFATTTPDPLRPPSGQHQIEVGSGQVVPTNHDGQQIFVDTGVFAALERLSTGLGNNDVNEITASLGDLDNAFQAVQDVIGELGARMNALDIADANIETLDINLQRLRSDLQDADIQRAVTELVARQSTFQAALLANAEILNTSLTDFLR